MDIESAPAVPEDLLRSHGLQVTAQRMAVLQAVSELPHGTAGEIEDAARERIGSISRQSVYDTLGMLTERGIVRSIQLPDSPTRYETRVGDNHHHFMCRSCGCVIDVECDVSGGLDCVTPAEDPRFEVHDVDVIYRGTCRECRSQHNGPEDLP